MTTFADMVENVSAILRGYVRQQDQSTHLTGAVDADDLVWTVGNASRLSPGRAEVDNEMVYIDTVDTGNNTITIAPYGRGMDGSVAASHSSLAQIRDNPLYPKARIRQAINATLHSVSEILFVTDVEIFTSDSSVDSYELPVEATGVQGVRVEVSENKWISLRQWRFDPLASTGQHSTGRAVVAPHLRDGLQVEVTYRKEPQVLDADSDDFTVTTGLPASCAEVMELGAAWRLLSGVPAASLSGAAISAADRDRQGGQQTEVTESLQMYRMFTQRLTEERNKLLNFYPTPLTDSRF